MNALTRWSIRAPKVVIALWLTAAIACAPLALLLPGALKAGGFNDPRGDATVAQQAIQRDFHEAPSTLQVVLHSPRDVTTSVAAVSTALRTLPHLASVSDYRTNPSWLSADRHTTFVDVGFSADETTVENLVTRTHDVALRASTGVAVSVTGGPALNFALNVQSQRDVERAELLAFPLLFLVLFLVFRSVAAMLVPAALAGMVIAVTEGIGYLVARQSGLSILFSNAVSMIGLAVAVDYSLFILKRYREELGEGGDVRRSIERAFGTAGHSVLFSGLSVVVALCGLFIPRIMVFTSIALGGALVTAVALGATATLLPAVLCLLGHNINWGSVRARRHFSKARATPRLAGVRGRPAVLVVVLLIGFGFAALPISSIRLQVPVASASILPAGTEARTGMTLLQDNLALRNLFPVEVLLRTPASTGSPSLESAVRKVTAVIRSSPDVASVTSVEDLHLAGSVLGSSGDADGAPLPAAVGERLDGLWAHDGLSLVTRVLVVPSEGPDADSTHALVRRLRVTIPAALSGVTVQVAGATAQGVDFDNKVRSSMLPILAAVSLATLLLLAWAFSSWLLPLAALAFNGLVVSGSLGLLTLWFQNGRGQAINSVTPLLLFAVMFGLSMDYMVIMISRMRELYRAGHSHDEAVLDGLRRTAGLVNGAAVIMVTVFLSFGTAKITIVQQLGFGLAIAVCLDAVVVRMLLMPAALRLLGARIWGRRVRRTTGTPRTAPLSGVS